MGGPFSRGSRWPLRAVRCALHTCERVRALYGLQMLLQDCYSQSVCCVLLAELMMLLHLGRQHSLNIYSLNPQTVVVRVSPNKSRPLAFAHLFCFPRPDYFPTFHFTCLLVCRLVRQSCGCHEWTDRLAPRLGNSEEGKTEWGAEKYRARTEEDKRKLL